MNPYTNFDLRPLCLDHIEMHIPPEVSSIAPSTGPARTQKHSRRTTPYNSPVQERHSSSLSSDSSCSSIQSLSSELEYSSDLELLRTPQQTLRSQQQAFHTLLSGGDHGPPSSNQSYAKSKVVISSPEVTEHRKEGTGRTVRISAEPVRNRGPPALVFDNDSDDDLLIPKPPGEVGRPGRGGYSLLQVLGWPEKKYKKVKEFINDLVEKNLDCELIMSEQPKESVRRVREQATEKFEFLKEYSKLWVIDDFIRNHLKYQKAVIKKGKLEKEVAAARSAAANAAGTAPAASNEINVPNRSRTRK